MTGNTASWFTSKFRLHDKVTYTSDYPELPKCPTGYIIETNSSSHGKFCKVWWPHNNTITKNNTYDIEIVQNQCDKEYYCEKIKNKFISNPHEIINTAKNSLPSYYTYEDEVFALHCAYNVALITTPSDKLNNDATEVDETVGDTQQCLF